MTLDTTIEDEVAQTDARTGHKQTQKGPSPERGPTLLHDAINTAPVVELRRLLIEIVDKNDEARAQASTHLLRPVDNGSAKRKAFETCINCDQDYSVEDNAEEACVYHDGEMEVDNSDDFWADHPDGFGEPEDLINEPDYADGFAWNCCAQKYETAGCIKTRHKSKEAAENKKSRMDVASLMN